nr:lysine/arginine/ornithine ABC transporter substrate-binding periplasmic protein [Raoultella sp. NCTC 9187]
MKIKAFTLALGMICTFSSFAASELRYGVEAEYPPFESRNSAGELEGFDIDLGWRFARPLSSSAAGWRPRLMR